MKSVYCVALILVIIGALNWGLVGLFDFNLVASIFGAGSVLSRIIYVLVAVAGIVIASASISMVHRPAAAR